MTTPVTIRRATVGDAATIAELQVLAWQWAYRGLIPDDYLDQMSDTIDRRSAERSRRLRDEASEGRTWVVEHGGRTVGFAVTGPSRDEDADPRTGEVWAIYLLPDFAGRGIGRALFTHAVDDLGRRGYEELTLWVLETNQRARLFYERAGWLADGATKTDERLGIPLHEMRYRASQPSSIRRAAPDQEV